MVLTPLLTAIRADLVFLHESWMSSLFQHQRGGGHPVLGRYRPKEPWKRAFYYIWLVVGIPTVIVLYPLVVFGFAIRLATMAMSRAAMRLGLIGVVVLFGIVWGLLAVFTFFQLERTEFLAVTAAAVVATASAAIAVVAHEIDGRATTVAVAYPAGVTAIFLPPIVAALLWEPLGDILLPASDQLAAFILDEFLFVFGLNDLIRTLFDLEGPAFIAMWLALSFVVGWLLGILVTLADAVRPRPDAEEHQRDAR